MTTDGLPTLEPMVRKLSYWVSLDSDDREAVLALPFTLRTIDRGGYIVREGEVAAASSIMLSGFAIRSKSSARAPGRSSRST